MKYQSSHQSSLFSKTELRYTGLMFGCSLLSFEAELKALQQKNHSTNSFYLTWPLLYVRETVLIFSSVDDFTPVILLATFGWVAYVPSTCVTSLSWILWWIGHQTRIYALKLNL